MGDSALRMIKYALDALCIEDIEGVTGSIRIGGQIDPASDQMKLSELCALGYYGLAAKLKVKSGTRDYLVVYVEKGGERIGTIDSDQILRLDNASLAITLGWFVATDGGRTYLVNLPVEMGGDYSRRKVDLAAEQIKELVRSLGTGEETFFGPYFQFLKRLFLDGNTARYGDSYLGAANHLWRTATRELGNEHPGYQFSY